MATGKPAQTYDALMARCATMTIGSPALPIAYPEPGEEFNPPTDAIDGKYLDVRYFPNRPAWEGVSDGLLDQGFLQVSVVWPKNQGLVAPLEAAGQVVAHFTKSTSLVSGSTKVTISGEPSIQTLSEPDRVIVPVVIPWTA